MIKLVNVCKVFKLSEEVEVKALWEVNLEVYPGEFVAIMGPSGSGKSTMVNSIGCLDIPTSGAIYLEGENIAHMSESELAQIRGKKIGFVFQQFNLIQTLTALENVMLPMIFQGYTAEQRKKRAEHLLDMVELEHRMDHKPNELSGGQQQRVAIARALANNPDVILADEPTGNLDSKTGTLIMKFLKKLHKEEKKTIILVTHDNYLARAAQRIAHLKDGKIIKVERLKR
ncbi:ABC transporter ATP-binding protein [Candidatus Woesearchaeota archaeon]|nr:ABC transporter ATP-binding protein [Candidatus Woesearchaeota archaeon]